MEVACTEIGASPGVSVTVEEATAADVEAVRLAVCWDGKCDDHNVQLFAGSDTVDQGCDGTDPNSACSATAVRNGTKVGIAEVPGCRQARSRSVQRYGGPVRSACYPRSTHRPSRPFRTGLNAGRRYPGAGGGRGLGLTLTQSAVTNPRRLCPRQFWPVGSLDGSRQADERTPPARIRAAPRDWPAPGCHWAANPSRGRASA
jgi:hypothetical protein